MRLAVAFLTLALTPLLAQRTPIPGDTESSLEQGIEAYKSGRYQDAIAAFQSAVDFDGTDATAHLYLGIAYMTLFAPGSQNPEAQRAKTEFQRVLEIAPNNLNAVQYLASLSYREAQSIQDQEAKFRKLDEARDWYRKVLAMDPRNKEAYYNLGVIDWMKSYPNMMAARVQIGVKPEDPGPLTDPVVRLSLKAKFGPIIEDGISNLNKALEIDPQYTDAMNYMNLLIREQADLRDSSTEYQQDIKAAEEWVQRSLETRKMKGLAQASGRPPAPQRIRVGGNVEAANLINKVDPIYPPLARQARVQGTVRFTVIIGKDGHVLNIQLLSGHPLLVASAQEAVKQWVYKPTLLNGEPVEVVTEVDVSFALPPQG